MSHTESPTSTRSAEHLDRCCATARMSGAGFAVSTSSALVTAVSGCSISRTDRSSASSAEGADVASTKRAPCSLRTRINSRAPGNGLSRAARRADEDHYISKTLATRGRPVAPSSQLRHRRAGGGLPLRLLVAVGHRRPALGKDDAGPRARVLGPLPPRTTTTQSPWPARAPNRNRVVSTNETGS